MRDVARRPRPGGDEGAAVVEFVLLAVLLMVPLVYVLIGVLDVQRAAFGATEAARQAGRALTRADGCTTGLARAHAAAALALRDQGVHDGWRLSVPTGCDLTPGAAVTVEVRYVVQLPLLGPLFSHDRAGIPVTASATAVVDRFRPALQDAPHAGTR